ncbi:MAG: DUF4389 domain-containing protein [Pseudomonadota bacterium]
MTTENATLDPDAGGDRTGGESGGSDRTARWWRGGYMLLFVIAFSLAQSLHTLIAVVQFLALIVFGEPNRHLRDFGASLAEWTRETSRFLTCADDRKPWPLRPWPSPRS